MPDKEKVIKGLECCKVSKQTVKQTRCDECPYKDCSVLNAFTVWKSCVNELASDALELLKEQDQQIENLEYALAITENNLNYYVNGND